MDSQLFLEHLSNVSGRSLEEVAKAFQSGFENWKNQAHFGTPERMEIFYDYVKARNIREFHRFDDGFAIVIPQTDFDSNAPPINTTLYLDGNYGSTFKMEHEDEFEFPEF
jgi:hypothetical protein